MTEGVSIPLEFDEQKIVSGFQKVREQLAAIATEAKAAGDAGNEAFLDLAKESDAFEKELKDVVSELNRYKQNVNDAKDKNNELSQTFKQGVRDVNIFGVNVGETVDKVRGLWKNLGTTSKTIKGTTASVKLFSKALIATGIGAILVALGALVTLLTKTQRGMDAAEKVLNAVGAVVSVLVSRFAKFAESIIQANIAVFKFLTLDFKGGMEAATKASESFSASINGLGAEILDVANKSIALTTALQGIERQEKRIRAERALAAPILKDLNKTIEDTTKGYNKRKAAALELEKIETGLAEREKQNTIGRIANLVGEAEATEKTFNVIAKARKGIIDAQELGITESTEADVEELVGLLEKLGSSEAASLELRTTTQNKLNTLNAERNRQYQEAVKRQKELNQAYEDETEKLRERLKLTQLAELKDKESLATNEDKLFATRARIEAERELAAEELNNLERTIREKAKAAGKEFEDQETFQELRLQVKREFDQQLLEAEAKFFDEQAKQLEAGGDRVIAEQARIRNARLETVEQRKELALLEVEFLEDNKDSLLSLETEKERARLQIQLNALADRKQILEEIYGPDSLELQLIDKQIQLLAGKISSIDNTKFSLADKIKDSLLKAFDITDEELTQITDKLGVLFGSFADGFTAITDRRISEQERAIKAYEDSISELEDQLSRQEELENEGQANSAQALRDSIEEEIAQKEDAQKKLLALQKKAAAQQFAIEAAQQASALAVSVANIIKDSSKFGLVGILTAAAGIGSLFALFKKYKAQTAEIAANVPVFRDGGLLDDRGLLLGDYSHENGGIGVLIRDRYGDRIVEAESNEMIMSRRAVSQYGPELEQMQRGLYRPQGFPISAPSLTPYLRDNRSARQGLEAAQNALSEANLARAVKDALGGSLSDIGSRIDKTTEAVKNKPVVKPHPKGYELEYTQGSTQVRKIVHIGE